MQITKEEPQDNEVVLLEGKFTSPALEYLGEDIIPLEVRTSHFQAVLPRSSLSQGGVQPLVLQFAGTGDHFYWRRRNLMALPMLRERNIGSIIIENPYYGLRRPRRQLRSSLHYVSGINQSEDSMW